MSCSPGVNQGGPRAYCPHYVLIVFFYLQDSDQSGMLQLCRPWAKVAYLLFIYSLCALHIYECHQLYQILFILSTSKSIFLLSTSYSVFIISTSSASTVNFVSIKISQFSFSYFLLAYYLLSFVAHLVLFTIPGSSRGVAVVGPSSSIQ